MAIAKDEAKTLRRKMQRLEVLLHNTTDEKAIKAIREMIAEVQAALDKLMPPG